MTLRHLVKRHLSDR